MNAMYTAFVSDGRMSQNVGMGVGIVLIVVGSLGFIPGITTQYDSLAIVGPIPRACSWAWSRYRCC